MDRETALKAIRENVKNENLIKYMLAVEAIRRIKGQLLTLRD
jgi:predicted hydrolase (HD superfamily)